MLLGIDCFVPRNDGWKLAIKKAQISKIENSLTDARFETILKVFKALDAKINFNVELDRTKTLINIAKCITPSAPQTVLCKTKVHFSE